MEKLFLETISGKRGIFFSLLRSLLFILSLPYGVVMHGRAVCYRNGILRSHRLPRPVISVGNITAGGTGKTPMVSLLARKLMERGLRVAVLSRGYGGSASKAGGIVSDGKALLLSATEAGDEPYLLATKNSGLIVIVGADRHRMGLLAMDKFNPDLFILDDGFQHLRLQRDLDILLLDCGKPFGNGHLLPAGTLREPMTAAKRADMVLFTRCPDHIGSPAYEPDQQFCLSQHKIAGFSPLQGNEVKPLSDLHGKGIAFAGIARPEAFFDDLRSQGLLLCDTLSFGDHACYDDQAILFLVQRAAELKADYLITTEKDAVKLLKHGDKLPTLLVTVLELKMADSAVLDRALDDFLGAQGLPISSKAD